MPGLMAWLSVVAAFVVSPNLLFVLGVDYASEAGSFIEKIHVATLLALGALLASAVSRGKLRFSTIPPGIFVPILMFCLIVVMACAYRGISVTNFVTSMVTPLLLVLVLDNAGDRERQWIGSTVVFILLANSALAIAEQALGFRLLPRIAGTTLYSGDLRSVGLLGHPLTASVITGAYIIHLVIDRLGERLAPGLVAQLLLHGVALLFFGGRLALGATGLLLASFLIFDGSRAPGRRLAGARRGFLLLLLGGMAGAALLSGAADPLIARVIDDEGSALTRLQAFSILGALPWEQLLTGFSPSEKLTIAQALGVSPAIEITWLAWVIDYGVPIAVGLVLTLLVLLYCCCERGRRSHPYMVALLLISLSGFLGLGGKTLLLGWFVVMLLTLRRPAISPPPARK